ncbi:hypothetical protein AB0K08_13755 [Citricoccus sp. NPDC055426]|uniref:hypothetical protein n=1 Tax=Citricoccus sp. NPDC055426 TaxID=3155536 RepID=UPI00343BE059
MSSEPSHPTHPSAPSHPGSRTDAAPALVLEDREAAVDLERFATRAKQMADTGLRLQVAGNVLACWVSVLQPRGLGDQVPVALGLRTVRLVEGRQDGLDAVYALSSVLERLARMTSTSSTSFTLPPVTEQAPWTAVTPPRAGWTPVATVEDEELQTVARDGIRELADALPQDPGAAMVAQARAAVWGRLLGGTAPDAPDAGGGFLPAGAAFAAHGLGFLSPGGTTAVHTSGPWVRLSGPAGFVLCRRPLML